MLVPRLRPHDDPLAPPKPMSTLAHATLDYVAAAMCFILPRVLPCGPQTRQLLTMAGVSAAAYSLFTNYEGGAVRKLPMPFHLNMDASSGIEQLAMAATMLRDEPVPGRLAVAALGAYNPAGSGGHRNADGPARLVPVRGPQTRSLRPPPAPYGNW